MTPDERQLIIGLFERMDTLKGGEKDPDAEYMIRSAMSSRPDAPYLLVQTLLVQEQALGNATERIRDLEQRVRQAEGDPATSSRGSFLGGALSGRGSAPTSVPSVSARPGQQEATTADAPSGWRAPRVRRPRARHPWATIRQDAVAASCHPHSRRQRVWPAACCSLTVFAACSVATAARPTPGA